jgi:hypothetical protein
MNESQAVYVKENLGKPLRKETSTYGEVYEKLPPQIQRPKRRREIYTLLLVLICRVLTHSGYMQFIPFLTILLDSPSSTRTHNL